MSLTACVKGRARGKLNASGAYSRLNVAVKFKLDGSESHVDYKNSRSARLYSGDRLAKECGTSDDGPAVGSGSSIILDGNSVIVERWYDTVRIPGIRSN